VAAKIMSLAWSAVWGGVARTAFLTLQYGVPNNFLGVDSFLLTSLVDHPMRTFSNN
jgi:hypothetical protein